MSDHKSHATDEQGRRSIVTLTKKRFSILEEKLKEWTTAEGLSDASLKRMREIICDALAFNPNVPAYTKEADVRRKAEQKKKLEENNMTTYEAYGKAYYEAHKQECMQRVARYKSAQKSMVSVS